MKSTRFVPIFVLGLPLSLVGLWAYHDRTPVAATDPMIPSVDTNSGISLDDYIAHPNRESVDVIPSPAQARQAELLALSETIRDESLVIAIREAGYLCYNFLGSSSTGDEELTWLVACGEAFAYLVGIDASGSLVVDPAPYTDAFSIDRPVE